MSVRPGQNSGTGGRSSSLQGKRNSTSSGASARPAFIPRQFGAMEIPTEHPGYAELPTMRFEQTKFQVSAFQHMGDRRTQEDRYLIVPRLPVEHNSLDLDTPPAVFGIFDGTVGDFASDNVKDIVVPTLLELPSWRKFREQSTFNASLMTQAFTDMFQVSDNSLLQRCSRAQQHYSTSTGVVMMVIGDKIVVGHLGDSRMVLGREERDGLVGEQATIDHKPDTDSERKRIEECGGLVERLVNHNNKPFIRGGDFMMRKALGEQPMQLQYSRAFGAKDLKVFGMGTCPDVSIFQKDRKVRCAIIASDGLWDVISSQQAVDIVKASTQKGMNPAAQLIRAALIEQSKRKAKADNVTVLVVQFD